MLVEGCQNKIEAANIVYVTTTKFKTGQGVEDAGGIVWWNGVEWDGMVEWWWNGMVVE